MLSVLMQHHGCLIPSPGLGLDLVVLLCFVCSVCICTLGSYPTLQDVVDNLFHQAHMVVTVEVLHLIIATQV